MKPIPFIMLIVGGVCIYAGIKKDNPLSVLKGVLTGGYGTNTGSAGNGPTVIGYAPKPTSTAYVPGGFKN